MGNLLSGVGFTLVVLGLGSYLVSNLLPKNGRVKLPTRIRMRTSGSLAFFLGMILTVIGDAILGYWTGVLALCLLTVAIPAFIVALLLADGRRARMQEEKSNVTK